eukprot:TRINITY_DN9373_c0_g1_i1.p1 TRINITY_DN9373_c0_g1~~TRINITY_DN9373_c0_g1_i1.p1  ORF type:complete len:426 (+),score=140.08 TRINITY_DN9373_c0_g1_i1:25-1302(+)
MDLIKLQKQLEKESSDLIELQQSIIELEEKLKVANEKLYYKKKNIQQIINLMEEQNKNHKEINHTTPESQPKNPMPPMQRKSTFPLSNLSPEDHLKIEKSLKFKSPITSLKTPPKKNSKRKDDKPPKYSKTKSTEEMHTTSNRNKKQMIVLTIRQENVDQSPNTTTIVEIPKKERTMGSFFKFKGKKPNNKEKERLFIEPFTMEKLVELQKEEFPDLPIPIVLHYLVKKMIESGGKTAEGIFRISIPSDLRNELLDEIKRNGKLDITADDPHVYAVTFKSVLREFPPFFPDYNICINSNVEVDLPKIWESLSEIKKSFLIYFGVFLSVMLEPNVVSETKMDFNNFLTVFSPCFLDNPSQSVEECFNNKSKEQQFLRSLMNYVMDKKTRKLDQTNKESNRISVRFNHAIKGNQSSRPVPKIPQRKN